MYLFESGKLKIENGGGWGIGERGVYLGKMPEP
jgi:hypothetical protein